MKNIYVLCMESSRELKKLRNLVVTSLFIALKLILDLFTVQILPTLHISFEFLVSSMTGFFFGPVVGAIFGGITDIINYIINPKGPYFPGFTISAIVTGVIYGLLLYKREITLKRCILVVVSTTVIVSLGLNTIWLSILYNKAFLVLFYTRLIKDIVILPINIGILYIFLKNISRIKNRF